MSIRFAIVVASVLLSSCQVMKFSSGTKAVPTNPSTGDKDDHCIHRVEGWNLYAGRCYYTNHLVAASFVGYIKTLEAIGYQARFEGLAKGESVAIWEAWESKVKQRIDALAEEMNNPALAVWVRTNIAMDVEIYRRLEKHDIYHHATAEAYGELEKRSFERADRFSHALITHMDELFITTELLHRPLPKPELNDAIHRAENEVLETINVWNNRVNQDEGLRRDVSQKMHTRKSLW